MHMSTDDYFVGDARNPRDENGEFDYETIECVDMPRLAQDLNALLAGETIRPRRFDFIRHEGYDPDFTSIFSENLRFVYVSGTLRRMSTGRCGRLNRRKCARL